jgi:hypothetical protein
MKKVFLTAVAVFTFGFMNGQEAKFGVKAGADFTSTEVKIGDSNTGFYVGGFVDVAVCEKVHVQPELLYVSVKGLDMIQMPILARFPIVEDFSLLVGPDLGVILNSDAGLKTFNFGLNLGGSFDISEEFCLEAKYNLGLTNLIEENNANFKLKGLFFGLGFKF